MFWNSSLLIPCTSPATVPGFLVPCSDTRGRYSCLGAGILLALLSFSIHLVVIQVNFVLEEKLCAVLCPLSSAPVRGPHCQTALCAFWVGDSTRCSQQLQIIIVEMQICVMIRISEFVPWHSQLFSCCPACPSPCGLSEVSVPLTHLYSHIYLSVFFNLLVYRLRVFLGEVTVILEGS